MLIYNGLKMFWIIFYLIFDGNYTLINDSDWHLNFKGSTTRSETNSAIADGNEYDGSQNFQLNFNAVKWINDNLKFKNTFYGRKEYLNYFSA